VNLKLNLKLGSRTKAKNRCPFIFSPPRKYERRPISAQKVVGQREPVPGHGPKLPDLGDEFPGFEAATYADADEFLMHVQAGYLCKDGVHGALLLGTVSEDDTTETICSACSPMVGGNNTGYGSTSGPD
jgi:hypothetical protein